MFHQVFYSVDVDFYKIENGLNFTFPAHIHSCYEVIFVTSGEIEITIGNNAKALKENDAAFIFPNQIHSLKTEKQSTHTLCIFSRNMINRFVNDHKDSLPQNPFFTVEKKFVDLVKELEAETNINMAKGVLYLICGLFDKQAQYMRNQSNNSDSLLRQIFLFVENNFNRECTLYELNKNMSYSYVYLSRYFKKTCGISFNRYVNHYRINEACYLIKTTKKTILQISTECGYESLRSFNRNFKEIMKETPQQYAKR